jgi:hypothetical protein
MKLRPEMAGLLLYRLAWLLDQGPGAGLDSALVSFNSATFAAPSLDALQVHDGDSTCRNGVET